MARTTDPLRKRISRRAALIGPVKFLVGCAVIIFVLSIFLQVRSIEVKGNAHYTAQDIAEAAGIEEGDNLFFINRFAAVGRIIAKLPYVETVSVETQLPGTVVIEVTESQSLAWVELEGQRWIVDRSCKVLTRGSEDSTSGLIRVEGLVPVNPSTGYELTAEGDGAAVTALAAMLDQIQRREMLSGVSYIDLTDPASPVMDYLGRFTVVFGTEESFEFQFGKLVSAVSQLTGADRGTLDLSGAGEAVTFTPF